MIVQRIPVGPLECNCYLVGCETTREALIVDPGDEADVLMQCLLEENLSLKTIFCTHAHFDHVAGLADLKKQTGAHVHLHALDAPLYQNLAEQATWLGLVTPVLTEIDFYYRGGEEIQFGNFRGKILHTPGHSPGSSCLWFEGNAPALFCGDTLFQGSIGRSDLWGGSYQELLQSLRTVILPLPDATRVYPGHGPACRLAEEKKSNPFLQERAEEP
jgi:glyoxylase-like metal-dependent hydrolase (beta-lactamase superfamily II)